MGYKLIHKNPTWLTSFNWKGKRQWETKRGVWTTMNYFYSWCPWCPSTPVKAHSSLSSTLQKSLDQVYPRLTQLQTQTTSYGKGRVTQKAEGLEPWLQWQSQVMKNHFEAVPLRPSQGTGNMCLAGSQNCYGPVTVVSLLITSFIWKGVSCVSPTIACWVCVWGEG